jgi:trigger factor
LEYTIRECENWRREIDVILPPDKIISKLRDAYNHYQQSVKLEGFRKGKIPKNLIIRMFGKKIEDEVFGSFAQDAYSQIRKEKDLKVISRAEVSNMKFDQESGLSFIIAFDVQPEFSIEGYKGLEVEKEVYEVTSEDVDEYLESIRQDNAMVYTVDEDAQIGHTITVDLQQLDRTGVPIIGKKYEDRIIELKNDDDVITPQLLSVKVDEVRRIRIPVEPEKGTENQREPREREEVYSVKVKAVSERRVPDLDDELAKDVGDFDTLAELRKQVETQLKSQAQYINNRNFQRTLADELVKKTDLAVPKSMLENYVNALVENYKKNEKPKKDEETIRKEMKPHAIRNIKWILIRDKLAQQENLLVTDAEIDNALNALEASGKDGAAQARKYEQNREEMEHLEDDLLEQKVLGFLSRHAKITERKVKKQKESELVI